MEYCFVEFQVDDCKRFNALCEVFNEIKKDKDNDSWRNEENCSLGKRETIQSFPRHYWMR
ncbi:hypothetical protein [Nostoc sp.]|uniref:hypothetical protein n=1 Tax=Nostoc sp. TaxID=1180 RepID=UPI002FF99314